METEKTVQVLLSTYNGARYLESQLESLCSQTIAERMCILVRDDGSTDGTTEILRAYEGRPDFRVEYGENIGITNSYFWLMEYTDPRCRYFALCDQDDVWLPEKLEKAVAALDACSEDKPLLFASRSHVVDENLNHLGYSVLPKKGLSFYNAMVENVCPGHTQVMNRALVERVLRTQSREDIRVMDWWVYLIASAMGQIRFDNDAYVLHRQHRDNAEGFQLTLWQRLKSKFARLLGREQAAVGSQLLAFQNDFAGYLPEAYLKELDAFIAGNQSFPDKLRYFYGGKAYRQGFGKTFSMKFLYLLDLFRGKTKSNRTHILVECPALIPSVRVGILQPLEPLNGINYDVRFVPTVQITGRDIAWADILITARGSELATLKIVQEAKRLDRFVVYYLDDDLMNLPKDSASYAYFSTHNQEEYMRGILQLSDVLWGVNPRIKEKYLPLCGGDRWVQNRVPVQSAGMPADVSACPMQILYAGSADHEKMIRQILSPAVRQVCAEEGDNVRFTFVGADPGLGECRQVRFHRFFEDYAAYRSFVEKGNFSIGLAVVRTDDFYQCKYYNKFVEYSSIGAAGIYTDCELYRQVVVNGENGLLCGNTTKGWVDAIRTLVHDEALRRQCIAGAQALLEESFQPGQIMQSMLSQMPELTQYRAREVRPSQVRLAPAWLLFYFEKIRQLFCRYYLLAVVIILFKAIRLVFRSMRKGKSL